MGILTGVALRVANEIDRGFHAEVISESEDFVSLFPLISVVERILMPVGARFPSGYAMNFDS